MRLLDGWHFADQGIYAMTTSRDRVPRKTRVFIDFLRARIGDPPSWEAP